MVDVDTLTADVSCLVGKTADQMEALAPIPMVHPERWYLPPGDDAIAGLNGTVVDGRVMASIEVCGPDTGRFMSMVAEDGVPFSDPFPSMFGDGLLTAPTLDGNLKGYINNRPENMLAVVREDGTVTAISAGKVRFGHSPDTIVFLNDLLEWHDREEGTLIRYRLHDVEHDGRQLLIATGGVVPGLSWRQLEQVRHAEVSPEFIELDEDGTLQYIALSMVVFGNTNTTLDLSMAARAARHIRHVKEEIPMTTTTANSTAAAVAKAGCSCNEPEAEPARAALDDDAVEARFAALEKLAERVDMLEAGMVSVVETMMAQISPPGTDRAALKARIETMSGLYEAVSRKLDETYGSAGSWVWLADVSADRTAAFFEVEFDGELHTYRESFAIDLEAATVALSGDRVEVTREVTFSEVGGQGQEEAAA